MFPDNPCSLLPKFADESYAGIWKLPKELSHLGGGGWNELKTGGEVETAVVAVAEMNIKLKVEVELLFFLGSVMPFNLFNRFWIT